MNKKKLAVFICAALAGFVIKGKAQSANTSLSDLVSPTKVNVNLQPGINGKHNLGGPNKAWKNLYLDSAIYLNGVKFITNKSGTAVNNTAIGSNVLAAAINGSNNTGVGYYSLYKNTSGSANTAIGFNTLYNNTSGAGNVAAGNDPLYYNTTGSDNIAIGDDALYENTKGISNIAIGEDALVDNTTSNYNVAIGEAALGLLNGGNGSCTAVGIEAGDENLTGSNNTFIGASAGEAGSSGDNNTMVGNEAGFYSRGDNNTYLGYHAANSVTTGSSNTIIGFGADVSDGSLSNAMALGNYAIAHASNSVRIGNSSVTSIGGFANWSNVSDGRVKKNIKQNVPGLAFINKLQPITYNLDLDAADKIINRLPLKDKEGKIIQPSQFEIDAHKAKEQIMYTGFIAQDVEKAAQSLNYDFSGVDKPGNANTLYGLRYSDFVVPLVKAVQELSRQNDSLKNEYNAKFAAQQQEIDELKAMIVSSQSIANSQLSTVFSSASLSQNIPNPFSNTTTINYTLPKTFSSAKIIITDKNGNALKQIDLPAGRQGLSNSSPIGGSWKGTVNIDASTLSSGGYQYSLYVDGRLIDSKQMMLAK